MEAQEAIQALRQDLIDHRLYCFVGSGPSIAAGIVTWDDLLLRMSDQLRVFDPSLHKEFNDLCSKCEMTKAGQVYKHSGLYDAKKQQLFDELFVHGKSPTTLHYQLIRLNSEGILTTNYDTLIEDAYAQIKRRSLRPYLPEDLEREDLQLRDRFFLAKLHGDASDWRTVVLGLDDYNSATWPKSVKPVLDKNTLLMIGFGGRDHLVNKLITTLPDTRIIIITSQSKIGEYSDFLNKSVGQVPRNICLVPVEHDNIEGFLSMIRPQPTITNVIDCPWGKMPPHKANLQFVGTNQEVDDFLCSKKKVANLTANPGSGLSCFLAALLEDIAYRGESIVCRLEAKTWLPLDAYVLYLLASLPPIVFETYNNFRKKEIAGWDYDFEAKAFSHGLQALKSSVIIAIEHADRLSETILRFWKTVASSSIDGFKLILSSQKQIEFEYDCEHISIGRLSEDSLQTLCRTYCKDIAVADKLVKLSEQNLHIFVLCACLISQQAVTIEEAETIIKNGGVRALCEKTIGVIVTSRHGKEDIQLLKACSLFRTPRTIEALSLCTELSEEKVRSGLGRICSWGLLMRPSYIYEYAMSTTIREIIDKTIFWKRGEREKLSSKTAEYFIKRSVDILDGDQNRSQKDIIQAVPIVSMALFHFKEAKNWDEYAKLICRMRRYLQNLCHFVILEEWIDIIPPKKADLLEYGTKYDVAYMRARIDRIKSIPKSYKQHLKEADIAIKEMMKNDIDCARKQNELRFEKGILLTMQRKYCEALTVFNKDFQETHNLKSLERIIQTSMSLGNLRAAADKLKMLDRKLSQIEQKNASERIHDRAMYHRHQSTLCTLRLMLYDFKPPGTIKEKTSLFSQAKEESEKCSYFSTHTGPSQCRHTIQDESGLGIACLKKAQALYALMQFEDSKNAALEGAGILAGYPNSRWWRMCCHDLVARCSALLREFKLAEEHLGYARAAFDDSGKDDYVRDCELKRTEGIIMLQRGKVDKAIELLRQSLDFKTKYHCISRCIEVFHLLDLSNALIANGQIKEAGKILARARKVSIIW